MIRDKYSYSFNLFLKAVLFILIAVGLVICTLLFLNHRDQRRRKQIDKNGAVVKAEVTRRSRTLTRRAVFYAYHFKSRKYEAKETSLNYYHQVGTGDSIKVKLDSINPSNSYILSATK